MFRVELTPAASAVVRHLPPDVKRAVRQALRAIAIDSRIGVPLVAELEGLWKYRVRRFRIVYEIDARRREIRVLAVGHRRDVYEAITRRIR